MKAKRSEGGGLVYSTEHGRMCPQCRQPQQQCVCAAEAEPAGDGIARVARETKGRGGKEVTVVRGLPLAADALAKLGKQLRTRCGSGGTAKDGVLEIQGDHVETVMAELAKHGFKVKRGGG
ncbi:translation initiation factor Sui1 [Chromobacterium sphagni]|uniref:Translation initiation factor SUI1 n=1 Tax=Chromobacterium sphagni TaxID=1903179 RepID=A0A1S1X0A7_9NEIS|nr:translation initiation factor Sui1 [Chromobacterium sphagni]OHX12961.1 translation initiation factor SUI1 [Chromobacterium sphagni]OHX18861.1 translation initiation factor SUI1 [Chromobacterium sphagni]